MNVILPAVRRGTREPDVLALSCGVRFRHELERPARCRPPRGCRPRPTDQDDASRAPRPIARRPGVRDRLGGPPVDGDPLQLPARTNATKRLSGDQNGRSTPSVPLSGRGSRRRGAHPEQALAVLVVRRKRDGAALGRHHWRAGRAQALRRRQRKRGLKRRRLGGPAIHATPKPDRGERAASAPRGSTRA